MNIFFAFQVPPIKDTLHQRSAARFEHQAEKMRNYMKRFFSKKGKEAPVGLEMIVSNYLCTLEAPYWGFIIKYSLSHH